MPWEKQVLSSMVQAVGYDEESKELIVTWTNGRKSAYSGVPEDVALDLSVAPSVGSMLNSDIKPFYSDRYVG